MSKNLFQAVKFELECGHIGIVYTSMYRLSKARLSCLIGDAVRSGVWCTVCKTRCYSEGCLGIFSIKEKESNGKD